MQKEGGWEGKEEREDSVYNGVGNLTVSICFNRCDIFSLLYFSTQHIGRQTIADFGTYSWLIRPVSRLCRYL